MTTQLPLFEFPRKKITANNPRCIPIDFFYTLQMADCTCCLAVQAGLKYGIQSHSYKICPYAGHLSGRHKIDFIDNDYRRYNHDVHLSVVSEFKPKYCTVRDYMTKEQCEKENIEFFSLSQILDYATQLSQYAEYVIIIPKTDVLDRIPEKWILGYSIPTTHGGTPLPLNAFKGRKVHLLGGSWKRQIEAIYTLEQDIISIDNNYIQKIAKQYGMFVLPNGKTKQMKGAGYGYLTNVRYAALALSFGAIGSKLQEIYS